MIILRHTLRDVNVTSSQTSRSFEPAPLKDLNEPTRKEFEHHSVHFGVVRDKSQNCELCELIFSYKFWLLVIITELKKKGQNYEKKNCRCGFKYHARIETGFLKLCMLFLFACQLTYKTRF